MRWTIIAFVFTTMVLGCSRQAPWEAPSAGMISRNAASLFHIVPEGTPGVVFFCAGDLNLSASHTANPISRTFDYSGTLTTGAKAVVPYALDSVSSGTMTIHGSRYGLSAGRVFVIKEDGGITQLPFAPLEPSDEYVTQLQEYLNANNGVDHDVSPASDGG